jgi:hypothetical protein
MEFLLAFSLLPIATYYMLTKTKKQPVQGARIRNGTLFKTQTPVRYESVYNAQFSYRRPGHISSITMKNQNLLSPINLKNRKPNCVCNLCKNFEMTGELWATGLTRLSPFDG